MRNFLKERKLKLDLLKNLREKNYSYQKKEIKNLLFSQCGTCNRSFPIKDKIKNAYVCPYCGEHFFIPAQERAQLLLDEGYSELSADKTIENPLDFEGYTEKKEKLSADTGLEEAVISFLGEIEGSSVVLCIMDSRFFMGSMGAEVGERITAAFETATQKKLPIVVFCASGGARMQEGMYSLMQMAKTSAAAKRHNEAGLLYISCLTNPTTGGVTASFAYLGDIILAEPNALIGFAGPRVIEQTMKKSLPEGFQRAEFLLEKGFVDRIISRQDMRKTLSLLLKLHERGTGE